MCQNCGKLGGSQGHAELHAHHIVPKSKGGAHSKSNLVTVCKQCHNAIHGNSYAPTKSGSVPGQKSGNILDDFKILLTQFCDFRDHLGSPDWTVTIPLSKVNDLRTEAFQIKTNLAGFNIEDAPPLVPDAYLEDAESVLSQEVICLQKTINLLDMNVRLGQEAIAENEIFCPDCEASVSPNMSYCSSCGTEIPEWNNCASCGENVDVTDEFCGNCGAELPEVGELVNNDIDSLMDEYKQLMEDSIEEQNWLGTMYLRYHAHCGDIDENSNTERVGWRYCPGCGFRHGVYKPTGGRTAECVLCEASWQESGIITKKWEMVSGEGQGRKKSISEWEKVGQEKNKRKEFRNINIDTSISVRKSQTFGP
jgi:hypothetical protein